VRDHAFSVSLGLEGFRVLSTIQSDGQVEVLIELKAGAGVCPGCGCVSTSVHEFLSALGRKFGDVSSRGLRQVPVGR
jgi:hypothetical protein